MKKLIFGIGLLVSVAAFAKTTVAHKRSPQSGMELEGAATMTSYPEQLSISLSGAKAASLFDRVANKKVDTEISTDAKVTCSSSDSCEVYWNK